MMATPWGPSAVPTGGAGVACPAGIWILTAASTFFLAMAVSFFCRENVWLTGRGGPTRATSELGDLRELELDRRLASEDVDQHLELELILVELDDLAGEVGEGTFLDADGLADLVLEARLGARGDLLLGLALLAEERLDVAPRQGRGLGALAHEPGHPRRVADDEPRRVVETGAHEQVAGEHLPLGDDALAVLEVDVVLHRDDDLVDGIFRVHRHDARFEVLLDLLLVARLGVDHEPPAGPVIGALDPHGLLLE